MKRLSRDALCWWWSLSAAKRLDIELSCLEEDVDLTDIIYLLSGQVFEDLQAPPLTVQREPKTPLKPLPAGTLPSLGVNPE
jgi:hypothetical protein